MTRRNAFADDSVSYIRERINFYAKAVAQGEPNYLGQDGSTITTYSAKLAIAEARAELEARGIKP